MNEWIIGIVTYYRRGHDTSPWACQLHRNQNPDWGSQQHQVHIIGALTLAFQTQIEQHLYGPNNQHSSFDKCHSEARSCHANEVPLHQYCIVDENVGRRDRKGKPTYIYSQVNVSKAHDLCGKILSSGWTPPQCPRDNLWHLALYYRWIIIRCQNFSWTNNNLLFMGPRNIPSMIYHFLPLRQELI